MAQKLKNMRLTSVDLVRAGANQEADICLFKSADPQEASEQPTEAEKNIFKRFIAWLRETPTEADEEPENPVEKADEPEDSYQDPADICKSAIIASIQSIATDETLSAEDKNSMIEKSISEYHETMVELFTEESDGTSPLTEELEKSDYEEEEVEEIEKFNHNHDSLGRFSSGTGGGGGSASRGASSGNSDGSPDAAKYRKQCQHIASTVGATEISGQISSKKVKEAVDRGGGIHEYQSKAYYISPQTDGTINAYTGTKTKSGGINLEYRASGFGDLKDAIMWGKGTILNTVGKSAPNIDIIEEITH